MEKLFDYFTNNPMDMRTIYIGLLGVIIFTIIIISERKAKHIKDITERTKFIRSMNMACSYISYLFALIFFINSDFRATIAILVVESIKDKIMIKHLKNALSLPKN